MRVFAPTEHRHEAEVRRLTGLDAADDRHRRRGGARRAGRVPRHGAAHRSTRREAVRAAYRDRYADEPFVRVVAHRQGAHRLPDPKLLLGSNYCDVGFAVDGTTRVTAVAALDNLVKGGAGNAVQCLNIRLGLAGATSGWSSPACIRSEVVHGAHGREVRGRELDPEPVCARRRPAARAGEQVVVVHGGAAADRAARRASSASPQRTLVSPAG